MKITPVTVIGALGEPVANAAERLASDRSGLVSSRGGEA